MSLKLNDCPTISPLVSDVFDGDIAVSKNTKSTEFPTLYLYYMSSDSKSEFNGILSCVVCAESQKEALKINPYPHDPDVWPGAESIKLIGKAFPGIKAGEV